MAKTIIKELIIILLICLAIILLLGILLYEYVPMTKTVPNTVSYSTPETVKKELAQTQTIEEDNVVRSYTVDANDLNNYKKVQNYRPGKANPFSSYDVTTENATTPEENKNSTGNTTSNTNNTNNNVTTQNGQTQQQSQQGQTQTSGGKFFQDKGTK